MRPGAWGKITTKQTGKGKFTASTYIRDDDGRRRQVERSGISIEDAERNLKAHLLGTTHTRLGRRRQRPHLTG